MFFFRLTNLWPSDSGLNWNLEMLVFKKSTKTDYPEKPLGARREPTRNSTHTTPGQGIKPGPHWWKASALTTAPALLPAAISIWKKFIDQTRPSQVSEVDSGQFLGGCHDPSRFVLSSRLLGDTKTSQGDSDKPVFHIWYLQKLHPRGPKFCRPLWKNIQTHSCFQNLHLPGQGGGGGGDEDDKWNFLIWGQTERAY